MDEFVNRKIGVAVVTFEPKSGSEIWLQETKSKLPMYIDPERKIYELFGLSRSVQKVFQIEVMKYYGEEALKQPELPKANKGGNSSSHQSDILQMGGDFTLSLDKDQQTAKVKFCYPSKTASDRPDIADILKVVPVHCGACH